MSGDLDWLRRGHCDKTALVGGGFGGIENSRRTHGVGERGGRNAPTQDRVDKLPKKIFATGPAIGRRRRETKFFFAHGGLTRGGWAFDVQARVEIGPDDPTSATIETEVRVVTGEGDIAFPALGQRVTRVEGADGT